MAKIGKKEYNLSDPKECTQYWTDYVSKELVGKKIIKVEYFTSREAEESMWYSRPLAMLLDDGKWLYPMRDDEGNDGGAMGIASEDGSDTYPVLSVNKEI
tara:strand:- start:245 stop:544 length:300 start_codon:yes stop_codon:yes gene_type:complete